MIASRARSGPIPLLSVLPEASNPLPVIAAGLDSSIPSLEAMIQGRFAILGTTGGSGTGPD
jgi:hypothetical protein